MSLLLRSSLLLALAFGIVAKPLLSDLCGMHRLGHEIAMEVGHRHAPEAEQGHAHDPATGEATHGVDRDHASGGHGLLHDDDSSSAYANLLPHVDLPRVEFGATQVPVARAPAPPIAHVSGPFRPPIA
jgi:hypothetical protein